MKAPVKMIEKWEQNNGELEPDIKVSFLEVGIYCTLMSGNICVYKI